MALTLEWRNRLARWREELPRQFYRPLGVVAMDGYVTMAQLTPEEALEGEFAPMPAGTPWGAKWEYAWFAGQIDLPVEAAGRRIVLRANVGGECSVAVDGAAAGAVDREHREVTLAMSAVPGRHYDLLIEAYAGHGARVHTVGPLPAGRESVPEPPETQAVVGESTYGIWEEDVYQLWLDVETLFGVRETLEPESLRVDEIDAALRDFTLLVDFEQPYDEMLAGVRACRERLQPLLACVNGSTAPLMYAFGHSHIDVAWLWPLAETERKCVRTFGTQLALMDEYPEYRFLQSQPHLYWMAKHHYPEVYERVKQAVARGQWMPEGGMWVEADTNLSGGESLIRQFMHGKRFLREEFGVESEILWLPDVFGYSGNMPQIMRGCGVKYFATAKIFWAYNGGDPFPYNTFMWEGIDGSDVLVHLCNDYNSVVDPATIITRWKQRVHKQGIATRLLPFGYGDGGGGPTRDHLEYIRREANLEGVPQVRIAHPLDYFHDQAARGVPWRYVGELYFQAHRGTYTSQARTKRGNRLSELALRDAELWGSLAQALDCYELPTDLLDEAWKQVLLNQFHDIIPGSSIHRVYEEAEADYEEVVEVAEETAAEACAALTDDSDALTVFNSLSWARRCLAIVPEEFDRAQTPDGRPLPIQVLGEDRIVEITVPSCGWATLRPGGQALTMGDDRVTATERSLENEYLRVELNEWGELARVLDKETGRELLTGPANRFCMYKDVPGQWDAWDLDSTYKEAPVALTEPAEFELVAEGPLVGIIKVTRRLNNSVLVQDISLQRGSRRVDFDSEIDWQERHKLLKVAFPVAIHAHEALHEIQFGHIQRPNHASRPFDADRFEVCNHKWTALLEENRGCAVLNDCKYGVNVVGDTINLTLLKSAVAPDMTADLGEQEFSYALYTWNGTFAECALVREGYELNVPVMVASGAAGERSLLRVDAADVVIDTVKAAEDGSGDVVVRLYESKRMTTRCTLTIDLPVTGAFATNMLEEDPAPLALENGAVELELRPFEIKTVRFTL